MTRRKEFIIQFVKVIAMICSLPALLFGWIYLVNWRELANRKQASIGVYDIRLDKSPIKLSSEDSSRLAGLVFTLNSDDTFSFSRQLPYFDVTAGTWEVEGYGPLDYYILLRSPSGRTQQTGTCCDSENEIQMVFPSVDKYEPFGNLYFVKRVN